jgi:hypothetical protein
MGIKPSQYERRLQIKHFFDDRQTGQTHRTWLEIQLAPPERSTEGWVIDGKVRLSLGEDRDIKGAFLLSIDEELTESLTSSPRAFYVPGQLTVTVESSLDLVLVLDLHYMYRSLSGVY